jgi:TRAP-type transport system periplasmic protein
MQSVEWTVSKCLAHSFSRRSVIGTGAAAIAASCTPGGEHAAEAAQGVLYGRAVSFTPPKSPWDVQWAYFRAQLERDPSIKLDYFNRGETGGEEQQMFDLRRGRAMVGGPSLQGLASLIPELTIAMSPYLFDSEAEVDFVYDAFLLPIFRPLFEAKGLHLLQWVEVGWTNLYTNGPVIHPRDAAGLKLRGSPNRAAQAFLRSIGADSIPLASTEIIPALQTGLITGGLGATVFHFFSAYRYASDFTLTKHSYDTGAIVMNLEWYKRASSSQRAVLDSAWMPSPEARASVRKLTAFALDKMREAGVRLHELDPALRQEWADVTRNVSAQLVSEIGGGSEAVLAAIMDGKAAFKRLEAERLALEAERNARAVRANPP